MYFIRKININYLIILQLLYFCCFIYYISIFNIESFFLIIDQNSLQEKFSLQKDFHRPNGFRKGGLCIAVLSGNRTSYLKESLTALFKYIQKYEPDLNYNLIWVDTASQYQDELNLELNRRFHFDRKAFISSFARKREFEGITTVYKLAISLCEHSEFFFPFEEDWKLVDTPRIGFINLSMNLLRIAPYSLMGLNFKDTETRGKNEKTLMLEFNNETFNITCEVDTFMQYCNGAVIYRMTNIKRLLRKRIDKHLIFEMAMTNYAKELKMYYGFIDFVENCSKPGYCYGVFHHIGKKSTWSSK